MRATAAALRLRCGQGRAADAFFQPNEHHEVQHDADRKGDDYIQDAVLLDEYRRGIDEHGEDDDADVIVSDKDFKKLKRHFKKHNNNIDGLFFAYYTTDHETIHFLPS